VQLVDGLSKEEGFDLHRQGDGVWTFAHKPSRVAELESQAAMLARLGMKARIVPASAFEAEAFRCSEQHGALFESVGFGLNPLAYCLGLASATAKRGAKLHAHSRVVEWRREGGGHRLITATGALEAKRVILATNGWMPEEIIPELAGRTLPLLSNIIATRPMTAEELARQNWRTEAPASNTRSLLAYLRMTPDKRLLFGGRGDTTGTDAGGRAMKRSLERYMARLFPGFDGMPVTHSWRGFIAATMRLTPAVGELPDDKTISYAFGCHGNGVAFMTWAGRELAHRIAGTAGQLPAPLIGLPDRFPVPWLRRWYLRIRLAQAWLSDVIE
jgi:glycine/D-amino acid oxidase-like deaminating enzyme